MQKSIVMLSASMLTVNQKSGLHMQFTAPCDPRLVAVGKMGVA